MFPRRKSPTESFDPLSPVPSRGSPAETASPESEIDDDIQSTCKRHKSISDEKEANFNGINMEETKGVKEERNKKSHGDVCLPESTRKLYDYEEREKQVLYFY